MKKIVLLMFAVFAMAVSALAQEREISGVVIDSDSKVTFTKITEPTANNSFTDGTNWTPVIIKAETAGVYTFVGRDGIADLSGYKAKSVGNSSDQVKFVGSFVNEVPSGDYASTTNYGITTDGTSFAKMGSSVKTTYYRAFIADGRHSSARELSLSFDDEATGISETLSAKEVFGDA